ncbi:MAG: hypothetical protein ACE5DN_07280, partial [Flavobacteriales bacterium]
MRALCKWASMGMAIVLLAYCGSSRRISSTNVAFLYKPEATSFHPAFVLCHTGDSITRLYFRFRTEELLYSRKEDGKTFRSKVKIKYKLLASADMPKVLDSATTLICDSDAYGEKKEIIGYLEIHAFRGNKYLLDVEASDEYRGQKAKQLLDVYKTDRMGRQNFLLCRADGQTPLFRSYVKNGEPIYLKYLGLHSEKLYARYYHRDFPLPGPPFSITEPKPFRYAADSLFTLGLNSANGAALQ